MQCWCLCAMHIANPACFLGAFLIAHSCVTELHAWLDSNRELPVFHRQGMQLSACYLMSGGMVAAAPEPLSKICLAKVRAWLVSICVGCHAVQSCLQAVSGWCCSVLLFTVADGA